MVWMWLTNQIEKGFTDMNRSYHNSKINHLGLFYINFPDDGPKCWGAVPPKCSPFNDPIAGLVWRSRDCHNN